MSRARLDWLRAILQNVINLPIGGAGLGTVGQVMVGSCSSSSTSYSAFLHCRSSAFSLVHTVGLLAVLMISAVWKRKSWPVGRSGASPRALPRIRNGQIGSSQPGLDFYELLRREAAEKKLASADLLVVG